MKNANTLSRLFAIATLAGTVALGACSHSGGDAASVDDGTIAVALTLPPAVSIATVDYTITGPAGFTKTGSIDVSHSATLSAVISPYPLAPASRCR